MSTLLDILQSMFIGGMILLMVMSFNFRMSVVSEDVMSNNLSQSNAISISKTLEHDFYKIGYGTSSNEKITLAEIERIEFISDIDLNGVVDTILYSISDSTALEVTENPHDKNLLRKVNNEEEKTIGRITDFEISYFDSMGNSIDISTLTSSTERAKIHQVGLNITEQAAIKFESDYSSSFWMSKIKIKNVN